MKKILILLLIIAIATVPSFADPRVASLVELVELAEANDLQLQINQISVEKLAVDQFEAHRKAGKIDYQGDQAAQNIMVYTQQVVAPQRADDLIKQQKINQLKYRDQLVVQVEDKLAAYELAKRRVTVAQGSLKLAEERAAALKLKLKLGAAIALDVIEADNAVAEAKYKLIDLENQVTTALLELKKVVGSSFVLDFSYDFKIETMQDEAIEEMVGEYLERDLSVIKARADYAVQHAFMEVIADNYHPNLREYKQAELDLLAAETARDSAVSNAKLDIVAAYQQLQVYYSNYQIAQSLQQIAESEQANNQTKYQLGVISKLDLAASDQALLERQFDLTKAISNYNQAKRNYLLRLKTYQVSIELEDIDLNDIYYR